MLKYVLQVKPTFLLQVLDQPKVIVMRLYRLFNAFLRDKNSKEAKLHWASWSKLCYPIEEGGLGMRLLEDHINALSIKLWVKFRLKKGFLDDLLLKNYLSSVAWDFFS